MHGRGRGREGEAVVGTREAVLGFEVRLERPGGIYTLISMDEYRDPHRVRLTPIVP